MCTATEAMVKLLGRADGERRRLFFVERTTGLELTAGALEFNAPLNDFDDVGTIQKFLDKGFWNSATHATSLAWCFKTAARVSMPGSKNLIG